MYKARDQSEDPNVVPSEPACSSLITSVGRTFVLFEPFRDFALNQARHHQPVIRVENHDLSFHSRPHRSTSPADVVTAAQLSLIRPEAHATSNSGQTGGVLCRLYTNNCHWFHNATLICVREVRTRAESISSLGTAPLCDRVGFGRCQCH